MGILLLSEYSPLIMSICRIIGRNNNNVSCSKISILLLWQCRPLVRSTCKTFGRYNNYV